MSLLLPQLFLLCTTISKVDLDAFRVLSFFGNKMLALKCNCSNDNLFTFSCNDAQSMKGLAKLQCFNGSEN